MVAWLCPPWDEPHGYAYEGGSSRLARFSGLCMNSMDVYVRAGEIGQTAFVRQEVVKYERFVNNDSS